MEACAARAAVAVAEAAAHDEVHAEPHIPDPSYWPPFTAFGLFVAGLGVLLTAANGNPLLAVSAVGIAITIIGIFGWSLEPVNG